MPSFKHSDKQTKAQNEVLALYGQMLAGEKTGTLGVGVTLTQLWYCGYQSYDGNLYLELIFY